MAVQDLQSGSSASVGLRCAATSEIALEQNTIGLIVLHACYIESVKAKHNVPQLLYDFLGQLHVLLSISLWGTRGWGVLQIGMAEARS